MNKREREDAATSDNVTLSKAEAEKFAVFMAKFIEAKDENTEEYNYKKKKIQKSRDDTSLGFLGRILGLVNGEDKSEDIQTQIVEILSDIATDSWDQQEVKETIGSKSQEAVSLYKWTYQIPYPKELDKVRISLLSHIPKIVKIQIEQSDQDGRFNLCIFGTDEQKVANLYRSEDLRIEAERKSEAILGADTYISWIRKYFPAARYDQSIGTKISYSRSGAYRLKTHCIFVPLPITASQILSFMSPVWIHEVKISAAPNKKGEILMAITSFAED